MTIVRHFSTLPAATLIAMAAAALSAQAPDRSALPKPGAPPAIKLPAVQKHQLTNGLPVWIVELHDVPIVQVNLAILTGSADDPPGKYGIARMTAAMLQNGAGSRSALEIADAVDFLGANLSTTSGPDSAAVRLHVPVARLAEALAIMADVTLRPTFPSAELDRFRQQQLTSLIQARDDPATVAQLAFARAVFGPLHRFGTALMGTAETIKSFTPADLRTFYQSTYRPDNATLIVAGDVVPAKILPLFEKSFGSWKRPAAAASRVKLPEPPAAAGRQVILVDKAGAPQSQVRLGGVGIARNTPDYFPVTVMSTVLGGSFSSRLNLNLREKQGFAYNAYAVFDMRRVPGPFYAYAAVQTDKTAEALTEFFREFDAIRAPIPAEELARTKNNLVLSFPEQFETTGDISANLETLKVYGLPDNYFTTYVPSVAAVTAADAQRAAQKYIVPDRMTVVVVGDLKVIELKVRALNLGPVRIMTLDEVMGSDPSTKR
jgi:predicted Zn-dependent peptidase